MYSKLLDIPVAAFWWPFNLAVQSFNDSRIESRLMMNKCFLIGDWVFSNFSDKIQRLKALLKPGMQKLFICTYINNCMFSCISIKRTICTWLHPPPLPHTPSTTTTTTTMAPLLTTGRPPCDPGNYKRCMNLGPLPVGMTKAILHTLLISKTHCCRPKQLKYWDNSHTVPHHACINFRSFSTP